MANFTRVNPPGWGFKADLTSAQANQLDIDHAKAVNGDDGSSHSPAAPVQIDGPGGIRTDQLLCNGTADVTGTLEVTGDLILTGATMQVDSASSLDVESRINFAGNLAGIRYRQNTSLGDADADITVAADTYWISAALTAVRTYTVRHTGIVPLTGQRIRIRRSQSSPSENIILAHEDASVICTLNGGFTYSWVELEYFGANDWRVVGWGSATSEDDRDWVWRDGSSQHIVAIQF